MKLIGIKSNMSYKDVVKPGDVIILAEDLPAAAGDLCIRDTNAGIEICKDCDGGLPIITIIRQVKVLE